MIPAIENAAAALPPAATAAICFDTNVKRGSVVRYLDGRPVAFGWMIPLTMQQRERIVAEATGLLNAQYSWLTYFYLAGVRLGIRPKWLRNRVARADKVICSSFVDLAYQRAGVALFQDGRIPGDVTPGDLANMLIERDWTASTGRPPSSP